MYQSWKKQAEGRAQEEAQESETHSFASHTGIHKNTKLESIM